MKGPLLLLWISLGSGCERGASEVSSRLATSPEPAAQEPAKAVDPSTPSGGAALGATTTPEARAPGAMPAVSSEEASTSTDALAPPNAYRWTSSDQANNGGRGASNIEITGARGGITFRALGKEAHVPAVLSMGGGSPRFMLDTWPSGDIRIAVDEAIRKTQFVGLTFTQPLTLRIGTGGTILVNEASSSVTDAKGRRWVASQAGKPGWFWLVRSKT